MFEVASRYLFGTPTVWVADVAAVALAWSIALAAPRVALDRAHVAITMLSDVGPGQEVRARMIEGVAGLVCAGAAWITASEGWRQFERGITTQGATQVPKVWITAALAVGLAWTALVFLRLALERRTLDRTGTQTGPGGLMDWLLTLGAFFGALIGLMLIGLPVFVAFMLVNVAGLLFVVGPRGFGLFANSLVDTTTTNAFATVSLFVLMGEILFRSGSVDVLFDAVDRLVGAVRGRLYAVVIVLSTVFGALSGSAVAVAALLGRSVMPDMVARGYDQRLSSGVILAGASLAPIIPPSLLAIIVGSLADVSIAGLLVAGIVPGLLIAALTGVWVAWRVVHDADAAPPRGDAIVQGSVGAAFLRMTPFLVVVFAVMGLIVLGVATPGESAATGVVGAILVAALYRRLSWTMLREALMSATATAAMILIIVASSKLFSQLLAFTGASRALVQSATGLDLDPMLMLLLMMLVPFVLCMFIDQVAFLLMAVPLYGPLVDQLGFDPVWFWTLFLINLTLGSLTPPFGYTLFAFAAASGVRTGAVFAASLPVIVIFVVSLFTLAFLPGLVTWLPGLMLE